MKFPSTSWFKGSSARGSSRQPLVARGDVFDDQTMSASPPESPEINSPTPWAQSTERDSVQEASDALAMRQSPNIDDVT